MDTSTLDKVTWATLDALNVDVKQHYNKTPRHPDYLPICRAVEKARTRLNFFREEFEETHDGSVTASDVQNANEWYLLCLDAERYMWALHYGSDCSCNPAGGDICRFCKLEKRYKEWKSTRGEHHD